MMKVRANNTWSTHWSDAPSFEPLKG